MRQTGRQRYKNPRDPKISKAETASWAEPLRGRVEALRGTPFTIAQVAPEGCSHAVCHSLLQSFIREGWLNRVLLGVYHYPRISALLNRPVPPAPFEIAAAWASLEGETLSHCRAHLENVLGFSTQVVARNFFVTSGTRRSYLTCGPTGGSCVIEIIPFHEEWPEGIPPHLQAPPSSPSPSPSPSSSSA